MFALVKYSLHEYEIFHYDVKMWNSFKVIIEPSALYWTEMVEHWPKTKFIELCRDPKGFKKSLRWLTDLRYTKLQPHVENMAPTFLLTNYFSDFLKTLSDIPKGAIMDHHHYASPMISPTAHHALRTVISGPVNSFVNLFIMKIAVRRIPYFSSKELTTSSSKRTPKCCVVVLSGMGCRLKPVVLWESGYDMANVWTGSNISCLIFNVYLE